MSLNADPAALTACHLDDYADAWAQRLMIPRSDLSRGDAEPDHVYRPRLLAMLTKKLES